MKVLRLDHVNICTGRLPETIGFYVDGLGLIRGPQPQMMGRPGAEARGAWLYDAQGVAILHLVRDDAFVPEGVSPIDHFALGCDDYDGFAARLRDRSIDFVAADYPQIGIRQLVVHDPNGIKVELNFSQDG